MGRGQGSHANSLAEVVEQLRSTQPSKTNNPAEYINHSGGAIGGDTVWETIGKEFKIGEQKNYRPEDLKNLSQDEKIEVENAYQTAVKNLGRRSLDANTFAGVLVRRDYLQAKNADSIFAISTLVEPGQKDKKGFVNNTKNQTVEGGTGYAVQMAINLGKDVYVFDQVKNKWFTVKYDTDLFGKKTFNSFIETTIPVLTKNFAGIGTREINESGKQAIRNVYAKTFEVIQPSTQPTEVKKGVEELFDSNPELANQVYEALGFIKEVPISEISKEIEDQSIESATEENKKFGYPTDNSPIIVEVPIVDNFKYKYIPVDGWHRLAKAIEDKKSTIKVIVNKITPQQKQQALQQYSQYLDTGKQDIEGFKNFVADKQTSSELAPLTSYVSVEDLQKNPTFEGMAVEFVNEIASDRDKKIGAYTPKGENRVIIAVDTLFEKYNEKAWTDPATQKDDSKATPLEPNAFSNFNEFLTFVMLHEKAHKYLLKNENEKTGPYEDRINNEAMRRLNQIGNKEVQTANVVVQDMVTITDQMVQDFMFNVCK
jgi:hypothetical protein